MNISDRGKQYIAIDVGGTKTRAVLAMREGKKLKLLWQAEAPIEGKPALGRFVAALRGRDVRPSRCAIDFAGPLNGRTEARMTNWAGNPVIRLADLEAWGLPTGHTLMLNDLEAGACGLLASEEEGRRDGRITALYLPRKGKSPADGPMAVIAPGTGLGTASIIGDRPRPSEVQHAAAAPLDERHLGVIAWFVHREKRYPSWEDLASGRGLAATYRALCAIDRVPQSRTVLNGLDDDAGAIARAAGSDALAREALDYYYGCVGRVAQLMALAIQPTGGVYLSGSTTAGNAEFIRKTRFLRELQANASQDALLRRFPVFMVRADLNLPGALWACLHPEVFAGN